MGFSVQAVTQRCLIYRLSLEFRPRAVRSGSRESWSRGSEAEARLRMEEKTQDI